MVRPGVSAVHLSATAYPSPRARAVAPLGASFPTAVSSSDASDTIGPCSVERTVTVTSAPPATLIVSMRLVIGRFSPPTT